MQATDDAAGDARFEAAVGTIVDGDLATLTRLLQEDPALVHARSPREYRATLLHYVGANGVERQHTPPNAVAIATTLLDAGADVNAVADMYRGSTTLALVATSQHPRLAGLQRPLIDLLLARGAALDHPAVGGSRSLVHSCLANGCPEAGEYLASRGAALDLESAAGVGRLDVVQSYFRDADAGTGMAPTVTAKQLAAALIYASFYGRTPVVQFLLDRGVDVDAEDDGFTGVNAAATCGQLDAVRLFIARGASLERRNRYGGTSLEAALWGAINRPDEHDYAPVIETLLAAGARLDPEAVRWWREKPAGSPDARARISRALDTHAGRASR